MDKKNWTLEEEEIVRKYYYREGSKGVQKRIPYRTLTSISHKAYHMGIQFYQKKLPSKQWTHQEIEILEQYYPIEGVDCYKRLPNRTKIAVKVRAGLIGLTKNGQPVWSQEEIDILKNNFGATKEELQKLLPNRTWEEIREKMHQRGMYKKINRPKEQLHWMPEEIAILRQYYPTEGSKCKKRLPGRSQKAIEAYVHKLGIENLLRAGAWSEEENEILRKNSQLTNKALQKLLPGRTSTAIQAQKKSHGFAKKASQPWSSQEDAILQHYYPIEGFRCEKRLPNRTRSAVITRAKYLMLEKHAKTGSWTTEELKLLEQFYPIEGADCCKRLPNRTKMAIMVRAKAQGLSRDKRSLMWSQEEIDTLKKNIGVTKEELQKLLPNRTWKSIEEKRRKLEIRGEIISSKEHSSWTPEEVAILRQYYATEGIKCQKRLPNRSKIAIQSYVQAMGLKGPLRAWSAQENEIIRKNLQLTLKALERLLPGRTSAAIGKQKVNLGLAKENAPPWSSEEDAILRHYYPIEGRKCKKRLPNRTYDAIVKRAAYIIESTKPIVGWSQKEIDILEKNFELTLDALQKLLPGRTKRAIRAKRTQIKRQLKM